MTIRILSIVFLSLLVNYVNGQLTSCTVTDVINEHNENLIIDPDFNAGSFNSFNYDSSAYQQWDEVAFTNPGDLTITDNANKLNAAFSPWKGYNDNGNFLAIDGSVSIPGMFWEQKIAMETNHWYFFEVYVMTVNNVSGDLSGLANFQFKINDTIDFPRTFTTPATVGEWQLFADSIYYTGATGDVFFQIWNTVGGDFVNGNDFAIDHLRLRKRCNQAVNNTPTPVLPAEVSLCSSASSVSIQDFNLTCSDPTLEFLWSNGSTSCSTTVSAEQPLALCIQKDGGCINSALMQVIIDTTAPIINPSLDTSACNSYTLPTISGTKLSGNEAYYTASNGLGIKFNAGDTISTSTTLFIFDSTITTPSCKSEESLVIDVYDTPVFATLTVNPSTCGAKDGAISLSGLTAGNYSWSFTTNLNETITGTSLITGQLLLSDSLIAGTYTNISVTSDQGCIYSVSSDTLIDPAAPLVDAISDTVVCNTFIFPAITGTNLTGNQAFYSATNGLGASFNTADTLTTSGTYFIFDSTTATPSCKSEESFVVTINQTPNVNDITDVVSCDSYTLLTITGTNLTGNQAFYSASNGLGTRFDTADTLTTGGTYFIFDSTSSIPSCSDEVSFVVTITPTPTVNDIADVVMCDVINYTLPTITGTNLSGNEAYYSANNGLGIKFNAGDTISTSTTLFIFDSTTTTPSCKSEESLVIDIYDTPVFTAVTTNPSTCGAKDGAISLSGLTAGNYSWSFTTNLNETITGTSLITGQLLLSDSLTAGTYTNISVTSEQGCIYSVSSVTLTDPSAPLIDEILDVVTCDNFTLPTITGTNLTGNQAFYSAANGLGTMFTTGDILTTSGTYFIFDSTTANPSCKSEQSFVVEINNLAINLVNDSVTLIAGKVVNIDVLKNDNILGTISSLSIVSESPNYTAATILDSAINYVSKNGEKGIVNVQYSVSNECGSDTAVISINIKNTPPSASDTTITLANQTSFILDLRTVISDEDDNLLFNIANVTTNSGSNAITSINGFELTYSTTSLNNIDTITVIVPDAGGESATVKIIVKNNRDINIDAGTNQFIQSISTYLSASSPTTGDKGYWSPVVGLTFADRNNSTTQVTGFKPENSPYNLVWNVEKGETTYQDTVQIFVQNVGPKTIVTARNFIINTKSIEINFDSLVNDPNQNLASIKIVTPFVKLESNVIEIDNERLKIKIDLTKSGISLNTNLIDSLEYEICDEFNECARGYIKVSREGVLVPQNFIETIYTGTVYNFISQNEDNLNSNFFFDVVVDSLNSTSEIISTTFTIVNDNQTSSEGVLYRTGDSFEQLFKNHIERIQVVIFNRWGDMIKKYEDYYGGQAYIKALNKGDSINENGVIDKSTVWRGKSKNEDKLLPGTYYYYIQLINKDQAKENYTANGFIELRN